ncbi:MAG: hypothetical protein ACTSSL_12705, partial [Candidatus Heimdallarchaeaceae archaeon]
RQDVPMTYMGDMVNYDPEKKVFRLVDYYFNPFENPQLDVDTLNAAASVEKNEKERKEGIQLSDKDYIRHIEKVKDTLNVKMTDKIIPLEPIIEKTIPDKKGKEKTVKEKQKGPKALVFEDLDIVEGITLEHCREVIKLTYEHLKKNYTGRVVLDIIQEQHQQIKMFYEILGLLANKVDIIEADRNAKEKLLTEATERLDEVDIAKESFDILEKKKKLTALELVLLVFSGIMLIAFLVLVIMFIGGSGGSTVATY